MGLQLRGRAAPLALVLEARTAGRGGAAIVGAGGVGKTSLAVAALDLLGTAGDAAVRISATAAAAGSPLGAFAPLLPSLSGGPTDLLGSVRRALLDHAAGGTLVLLVDDAHLLDQTSASLLLHLAGDGRIFTVVTVRLGEPCSDAVAALWRNGLLERVDLAALDDVAMAEILDDLLDGPVDDQARARMLSLAAGSPLALSELVLDALGNGALEVAGGRWTLRRALGPAPRLAELVAERLGGLDGDQRRALELVALGEPIGVDHLVRLSSAAAVTGLEERRLLSITVDGRRSEAWLVHPLHGEVLRAELATLRRRELLSTLVESLRATGSRRRGDVLRLGTWMLELGRLDDPALLLEASRQAYVAIDFDRAVRLAEAAWAAQPSVAAGHLLGWLRCSTVDHDGAEAVLAASEPLVTDDRDRVLVAMARSENLFRRDEAEAALAVVAEAEAACTEERWREELLGHRATLLMLAGEPGAAGALVAPIVDRGPEPFARSYVEAAIAGSMTATFDARPLDGLAVAERAFAAHLAIWEDGVFLDSPGMHVYNSVVALVAAGRFDAADEVLEALMSQTLMVGWGTAQAALTLQRGLLAIERGRPRTAVGILRRAVVLYDEHGPRNRRRFPLAGLLVALALVADVDAARAVEAELEAESGSAVRFTTAAGLVARSWLASAEGRVADAVELLERAVDHGVEHGERAASVEALQAMVRQGHRVDVTVRLDALREAAQGELLTARLDHVDAVARGDGAALTEVAGRFEAMGAVLLAAEANAAAAVAHRNAGEGRLGAGAAGRAARLGARCEGASTPALAAASGAVPVTPRELAVARLAAQGLTSKEIAARLTVSVRTVDNQLQAAYGKLGVRSRRDLAAVLARDRDESLQ